MRITRNHLDFERGQDGATGGCCVGRGGRGGSACCARTLRFRRSVESFVIWFCGCQFRDWRGLWGRLGDRRAVDGLSVIHLIWRIREPEIAVMPQHDAERQQEQTERSHHQAALAAVDGRTASTSPLLRYQCELGFWHNRFKV